MPYMIANGKSSDGIILENDRMTVLEGGTAYDTTVNDGGALRVSSGGTANITTVNSGGTLYISSGGTATDTTVFSGGWLDVSSGGTANITMVNDGGMLRISSGGSALNIVENGGFVDEEPGANVSFIPNTINDLLIESSTATIHSGTTANNTTIDKGRAFLYIYSGGTANITTVNKVCYMFVYEGGTANNTTVNNGGTFDKRGNGAVNNTTVNDGGRFSINSGGTANSTTVNDGGWMFFSRYGGTANGVTVNSGGELSIKYGGGKITGKMTFESGARVALDKGVTLDFDLTRTEAGAEALVNDLSIIQGTPLYTLTVDEDLAPGNYVFALADGATKFSSTISVVSVAGDELAMFAVGETVKVGYDSYTLNLMDGALSVSVEAPDLTPQAPVGTPEKVSWETTGANEYVIEYSTDNFEHVIRVETAGNAIDMPDLPAGMYQWRVKADANSDWAVGEEIVSAEPEDNAPKVVQAVEDGSDDLFFASANGTWGQFYYALHVGSIDDWTGTNELVSAEGKARIQNLFFGSDDPNVLCLTDADNGDALFVDDIYTASPENIAETQARIAQIDEIRAGSGNDIVDMTSQQFEYIGDGLTIRGGSGNDTIWANKGDNKLFGDAGNDRIVGASGNDVIAGGIGNDRMHGGGGDDVFTFCNNWGADNVEQLADGFVTLWFASGDESNWNATSLTYSDGANSVKVSGIAAEQITLKFGDDGSDEFAELTAAGAFFDATTERIFEESGKGMLASI